MLFNLKNDNYGPIRDAAAKELARLGDSDELAQFLDASHAVVRPAGVDVGLRGHHHPRRAEAALGGVVVRERLLNRRHVLR